MVQIIVSSPYEVRVFVRRLDGEGNLERCRPRSRWNLRGRFIIATYEAMEGEALAVTWIGPEDGGDFWIRATGVYAHVVREGGIEIKGAKRVEARKITARAKRLALEMEVSEEFAQILIDEKMRLGLMGADEEMEIRARISDKPEGCILGYLVLDRDGELIVRGKRKDLRVPLLIALVNAYKEGDEDTIRELAEQGVEEAELIREGKEKLALLRISRIISVKKEMDELEEKLAKINL